MKESIYERAGYLQVPLSVTRRDGYCVFSNQAAAQMRIFRSPTAWHRALPREDRATWEALSEGRGCLLTGCRGGVSYPFFAYAQREERWHVFFAALSKALPLLSPQERVWVEDRLSAMMAVFLQGEADHVILRVAMEELVYHTLWGKTAASVTALACRLLPGEVRASDETLEGYGIEDPMVFFTAAVGLLRRLQEEWKEGIASHVTLTVMGDELFFSLPCETIPAGRVRALAAAERPDAFYYRRGDLSAALCLTAASELMREQERFDR